MYNVQYVYSSLFIILLLLHRELLFFVVVLWVCCQVGCHIEHEDKSSIGKVNPYVHLQNGVMRHVADEHMRNDIRCLFEETSSIPKLYSMGLVPMGTCLSIYDHLAHWYCT
jgi:hypothetical protein